MRALCVNLLVEIEARLDFEDDLPPLLSSHLIAEIEGVKQLVEKALESAERGRLLRTGLAVRRNEYFANNEGGWADGLGWEEGGVGEEGCNDDKGIGGKKDGLGAFWVCAEESKRIEQKGAGM